MKNELRIGIGNFFIDSNGNLAECIGVTSVTLCDREVVHHVIKECLFFGSKHNSLRHDCIKHEHKNY